MQTWTAMERRWGQAVLQAMMPGTDVLPDMGSLELSGFWQMFEATAPALLKLGFRLSVWAVVVWTVMVSRRPFAKTSADQRDQALSRMADGVYLVRQLVVTIKVVATLAYFSDAGVRRFFPGAG